MAFERINAESAIALINDDNAQVIDIRDQVSFESGSIKGSMHIHNANVQSFIEESDKSRPLIVCCYHGNMSQGAADYFNQQGFERTYSLDGGYSEWSQRYPDPG